MVTLFTAPVNPLDSLKVTGVKRVYGDDAHPFKLAKTLSASKLKYCLDLREYVHRYVDRIIEYKETEQTVMGLAFHTGLLEPHTFKDKFDYPEDDGAVAVPLHDNGAKKRLTYEQVKEVRKLCTVGKKAWGHYFKNALKEPCFVMDCEFKGKKFQAQVRPDVCSDPTVDKVLHIYDLKTFSTYAPKFKVEDLKWTTQKYHYGISQVWYEDLLRLAYPEMEAGENTLLYINKGNYLTYGHRLSREDKKFARITVAKGLTNYLKTKEKGFNPKDIITETPFLHESDDLC